MGNDRWRLLVGQTLAGLIWTLCFNNVMGASPQAPPISANQSSSDDSLPSVSIEQVESMLKRRKSRTHNGVAGRLMLLTGPAAEGRLALTASQQQAFRELLVRLQPKPEEFQQVIEKAPANLENVTDKQAKKLLASFLSRQKERVTEAEEFIQGTLRDQQFDTLLGIQASEIGPTALFDPVIRERCDVPKSQILRFAKKSQEIRRRAAPADADFSVGIEAAIQMHTSLQELDESILQSLNPSQRDAWDHLIQRGQ